MYEKRSPYFVSIFSYLGIKYSVKDANPSVIDNNKVLRTIDDQSLGVYFNEATDSRACYFALDIEKYSTFDTQYWLLARNNRKETKHLKLIPYPGEEVDALRELLVAGQGVDT